LEREKNKSTANIKRLNKKENVMMRQQSRHWGTGGGLELEKVDVHFEGNVILDG